jgi:hypothetical protein
MGRVTTKIASFGTPERREQDLAMMKSPNDWPIWPKLPLKRPGHDEHGYLINTSVKDDTVEPKVYMRFIFQEHEPTAFREYESLEAVVSDGWTVD